MNYPDISIIIPVKKFNARLELSLKKCLELDYPKYEVIVFPDEKFSEFEGKVKIIPTGSIGPALKRDLALKHSNAELFAFLDDDAYPEKDWLKNAVKHFENKEIAAVGGPGITPEGSPIMEEASGGVYASVLASGNYIYRYMPTHLQEVDDYPSCNFIVRRDIFEKVGGFNQDYWPGEDTKLCLDITRGLGLKIIYDPEVVVQHHRRLLFMPHLKQVANYALHRGYFAAKGEANSLKPAYFVPALFVIYILTGAVISFYNRIFFLIYFNSLVFYYSLIFFHTAFTVFGQRRKRSLFLKLRLVLLIAKGIILTHFCYGIFFIKGLTAGKLKEETS